MMFNRPRLTAPFRSNWPKRVGRGNGPTSTKCRSGPTNAGATLGGTVIIPVNFTKPQATAATVVKSIP